MSGQKDIWEARVDYKYRFTFTLDNDTIDQQLASAVKDAKGIENVLRGQYSFDNIYTIGRTG